MTIGRKLDILQDSSHKFHIKSHFAWSKFPCETVKIIIFIRSHILYKNVILRKLEFHVKHVKCENMLHVK